MDPHALAPTLIDAKADWASFIGNTASVLGFFLSVATILVTFSVKRQVRNIERTYVMRLRSKDWASTLNSHAVRLLTLYGKEPLAVEEVELELIKVGSLIKTVAEQIPPGIKKEALQVLKEIEAHRSSPWFRRRKILNATRVFDLSLELTRLGENLKHRVIRIETLQNQ